MLARERERMVAWGRYEAGEVELTGKVQRAIACAFGWPTDWPDTPAPAPPGHDVSRLVEEVRRLAQVVDLLAREARDRLGVESEIAARLAALEAAPARRPSP